MLNHWLDCFCLFSFLLSHFLYVFPFIPSGVILMVGFSIGIGVLYGGWWIDKSVNYLIHLFDVVHCFHGLVWFHFFSSSFWGYHTIFTFSSNIHLALWLWGQQSVISFCSLTKPIKVYLLLMNQIIKFIGCENGNILRIHTL